MAHAPAASPVALAETIATLQADLARNRAAGVQAKHARYRAKKEAASGGFSPLACKAIVAVYVLSDCYMELALRFAALWPAVKPTSGTTRVVVEDFFLSTTDLDLQHIFTPSATPWARPVRHAAAFLAEANTFNWVLACNHVGVAPLSLDVYATWEKARFGSLLEGLPPRRIMGAALPSQVEPAAPSPTSTSAQGPSHGAG